MTDSLTSLQLISIMLPRPQGLQHHKHRPLLSLLTPILWARQAPVTTHKVRAHIECAGRYTADRLAKSAHMSVGYHSHRHHSRAEGHSSYSILLRHKMAMAPTPPSGTWTIHVVIPPEWLRLLTFNQTPYVLSITPYQENQPCSPAILLIFINSGVDSIAPLPSDSGILIQPSTAFQASYLWVQACPPQEVQAGNAPALHQAPTPLSRSSGCLPSGQAASVNSISHQCGPCRHPPVHAIICLRHEYAVYKIAMAIRQGTCGDCYLYMYMDAEGRPSWRHERFSRNQTTLPLWVCAQTPSRPDIVPFPSIAKTVSEEDLLSFTPEQRSHHSVILLEVSFAGDTKVTSMLSSGKSS